MAKKTKIKFKVKFEADNKIKYVASSALQKKDAEVMKTTKTLGKTKPNVEIVDPVIEWDVEGDPKGKTVKLAIAKITSEVTYRSKVFLDKAIDKKSKCHKHCKTHELEHVKLWKQSIKGSAKTIEAAFEAEVSPTMDAPKEIKSGDIAKEKAAAYARIEKALHTAVIKAGKAAGKHSRKIHTPAELAKTNELCADYLTR